MQEGVSQDEVVGPLAGRPVEAEETNSSFAQGSQRPPRGNGTSAEQAFQEHRAYVYPGREAGECLDLPLRFGNLGVHMPAPGKPRIGPAGSRANY